MKLFVKKKGEPQNRKYKSTDFAQDPKNHSNLNCETYY